MAPSISQDNLQKPPGPLLAGPAAGSHISLQKQQGAQTLTSSLGS